MRNWPYAYLESMKSDAEIRGRVGVIVLPTGDADDARYADMLGGIN
jgi:hypothetical protein